MRTDNVVISLDVYKRQMYTMPWALPGPIGAVLTTGLDLRSLVLMAGLLVVDFVIYYPVCKAYDHQLCLEESAKETAGNSDADAIAAQENRCV